MGCNGNDLKDLPSGNHLRTGHFHMLDLAEDDWFLVKEYRMKLNP